MVCSTILPVKSVVSIASQLKLRKDTWARICHYQHTHWQLSLFCLQVFPSLYNISVFVCKLLGHINFVCKLLPIIFFTHPIIILFANTSHLQRYHHQWWTPQSCDQCDPRGKNPMFAWSKTIAGWWYTYPSEKWWSENQLGWWWHSQYMEKNSHVPNHQPAIVLMFESNWIRLFLPA